MICKIAKHRLTAKEKEQAEKIERRKCIKYDICPECGANLEHKTTLTNIVISKCKECEKTFSYCK